MQNYQYGVSPEETSCKAKQGSNVKLNLKARLDLALNQGHEYTTL